MIIDATAGIAEWARTYVEIPEEIGSREFFTVNKIDGENVNFRSLMEEIESFFGKKVIPFSVPIGEGGFVGVTDVIFQKV